MKKIYVCAAAIIKDKKVFVSKRSYGEFRGKREFPGGKIEEGETIFTCIKREILEELNARIVPENEIISINYKYPAFYLTLHLIKCTLISEKIELLEHEDGKFVSKNELDSLDFLPADLLILDELKKYL